MARQTATALILLAAAALSTGAAAEPRSLCRKAALQAEKQFAIPDGLLQAISLVETGHAREGEMTAWPWTVNINGAGHYFKTRAEAERFVKSKKALGAASVDIGCFQINTKWHGKSFASPAGMFEPMGAALYAASFLSALYTEFGNWDLAVRSYHSRSEDKGARYGAKVAAAMEKLGKPNPPPALRGLSYTPVRAGATGQGGVALSLFTAAQPIFDAKSATPLLIEKE